MSLNLLFSPGMSSASPTLCLCLMRGQLSVTALPQAGKGTLMLTEPLSCEHQPPPPLLTGPGEHFFCSPGHTLKSWAASSRVSFLFFNRILITHSLGLVASGWHPHQEGAFFHFTQGSALCLTTFIHTPNTVSKAVSPHVPYDILFLHPPSASTDFLPHSSPKRYSHVL